MPGQFWINNIFASIEYHLLAFFLGFFLQYLFDRIKLGDVDFQVCMVALGIMWILTVPLFWFGLLVSLIPFTSTAAMYIGGALSRKELTVRNGVPWIAFLFAPGLWWSILFWRGFMTIIPFIAFIP